MKPPPNEPIWLANLRWLHYAVPLNDYIGRLAVLCMFAPMCERWIDAHMIAGSPENIAIAEFALRLFTELADWEQIEKNSAGGLAPLRSVAARLRRVLAAADVNEVK